MNFKGKDGVFESIRMIHNRFCYRMRSDCFNCVLNKQEADCVTFVKTHPAEAAYLMGYEVVEDNRLESDTVKGVEIDQFKKSGRNKLQGGCNQLQKDHPANDRQMTCKLEFNAAQHVPNAKKALKGWTLEEVKEYCNSRSACDSTCRLSSGGGCRLPDEVPGDWDLTEAAAEAPRLTLETKAKLQNLSAHLKEALENMLRCATSLGGLVEIIADVIADDTANLPGK